MSSEAAPLRIEIVVHQSDGEEQTIGRVRAALQRDLEREELQAQGVTVERAAVVPQEGQKSAEALALGGLLVTLLNKDTLGAILGAAKAAVQRFAGHNVVIEVKRGDRSVRIEYNPALKSAEEALAQAEAAMKLLFVEPSPAVPAGAAAVVAPAAPAGAAQAPDKA